MRGAFSMLKRMNMKFSFSPIAPRSKDIAVVSWKKQKQNEVLVSPSGQKNIVLGIAEPEKLNRRKFIILARQIITLAKANRVKKIALRLDDFAFPKLKLPKEEIVELLERINKFGTTVILVTHNKDIVNNLKRRVLTLHDGRLISDQAIGKYVI